jgi:hypoxanthine phosphoribosyltransferase
LDYKVVSSKYRPSYYAYEWDDWVYIVYPWENAEAYRAIPRSELMRIFSDAEVRRMAEVVTD